MNTKTAIASQPPARGVHASRSSRGVPIEVAQDIIGTVVTVQTAQQVLGVAQLSIEHSLPHVLWVPEIALRALTNLVYVVPTVFSTRELVGNRGDQRHILVDEHALGATFNDGVSRPRYKLVLRDMPHRERECALKVAAGFGLKAKRLDLSSALASVLLSRLVLGTSLTRPYLTSTYAADCRHLMIGPTRSGKFEVKPVWPGECPREMLEFRL